MGAKALFLPIPYSADCSGIYAIVNRSNGKVYIGSAVHLRYRLNQHRHGLVRSKHHSQHLQRSFNKTPDAFYAEIIEELPLASREHLLEREQFWIHFYQSFKREMGYNISPTASSCLGIKHSPEYCAAISQRRKGKPFTQAQWDALRNRKKPWRGRSFTTEQRKAFSLKYKGKSVPAWVGVKISKGLKASSLKNKAVSQFSLDGVFIKTFRSAQDAEIALTQRLNISDVCRGFRRKSGGFLWRYGNDQSPIHIQEKRKRSGWKLAVARLSETGEVLNRFESSTQAAQFAKVNSSSIRIACQKNILAGGSKWRFDAR